MKQSKLEELWVIYDKQENCFIKFGTKAAWVTSGAAKNAWNCHNYSWPDKTTTFNDQSRFVVLNIYAPYSTLGPIVLKNCGRNLNEND